MKILYVLLFIVGCVYFLGAPYLFYINKLSTSELISILAVVPLSLIAIFQEQLKRWFFAPKLQFDFSLNGPFCSKTPFGFVEEVPMDDGRIHKIMPYPTEAYYFRFGVCCTNIFKLGKSLEFAGILLPDKTSKITLPHLLAHS